MNNSVRSDPGGHPTASSASPRPKKKALGWGLLLLAGLAGTPTLAADLKSVDRTIAKQPVYKTKPRFAYFAFGSEAKDRVWLVHDGDTLYVDRNGNGDLTEPNEAIAVKREPGRDPKAFGDLFEVSGELRVGGRVHDGLRVWAIPLALLSDEVTDRPSAKAALAANPQARVYIIGLNVDRPGFRGAAGNGRVLVKVGPHDVSGALLFADKPADAPVIHMDGPLQISTDGEPPTLKLERDTDLALAVGTPGLGSGTFAKLAYDQTIPVAAVPRVEVAFPPAKVGDPPVRQLYELKERC